MKLTLEGALKWWLEDSFRNVKLIKGTIILWLFLEFVVLALD